MKELVLTKDLSWYREELRKMWCGTALPKPIPYLYEHPFYPLVCHSFLTAQNGNNTNDFVYRAMVNKIIMDFVSENWETMENALMSMYYEIHLNRLCRNIRSCEEVVGMWEKAASYLRWYCYSDTQLNTLYYDQRLFVEHNADRILCLFGEFMEQWRCLLNKRVEQIMNSLFGIYIQEVEGEYEYTEGIIIDEQSKEKSVLSENNGDEDEETKADCVNAQQLGLQETYGNKFTGLINGYLYDKYKEFVRDIVETLGRVAEETQREHLEIEALLQYSFPVPPYEDIEGISSGNRIMDLLPSEYAIMSDQQSEILFYQKFASRQLQQFSCFPKENRAVPVSATETDMGPIIISIDTSGSMGGNPVDFARLLVVDAFRIARKEKRPLYLIQFSVGAQCIDLSGDTGEEELLEFLSGNHSGGSDGEEMLWAILQQLKGETYSKADALIVSDFYFAYCYRLEKDIKEAQQKGARFYALNVRPGSAHPGYAKLLDKIWEIHL